MEQVPQVAGQAAEIPVRAQRFAVSLFATQEQYLEKTPSESDIEIFNLRVESAQARVRDFVGKVDGETVDGAWVEEAVGVVGEIVGIELGS